MNILKLSRLTVVRRAAKKLQSARPIKRRAATTVSYLRVGTVLQYVTEFWKITHMGAHEIIRIFMFSVLLIRAGKKFKNISRISCTPRY